MTRALAVLAAILVPAVLIWTLGHFTGGIVIGTLALAVIWWYAYRAWRADRERRRRYRAAAWRGRVGSIYIDVIPQIDIGAVEKGTHP